MEILINSNVEAMAHLGQQPIKENINYRFMKYCLVENYNNGKLIFNGLTRAFVYMDNSEIINIGNVNDYAFLYKNYFLVPENFNEQEAIDSFRKKMVIPVDVTYLDHPVNFTILTTTKCNARCKYCYEMFSKGKKHMTQETALKVSEYIHNYAPIDATINLAWFGGEPLFNMKVIDQIDNYLIEKGRSFTNTIISNGYLFDKEVVTKAKYLWNLVDAQITIDGTEQIYNTIKNYIYKDNISPYKKVLNNIAMLLNNGIQVSVRLNIDNYNADNLKLLVKELHQRFGNHPNLSIYAWPIFEDNNYKRTKEEHIQVFEKLNELESLIDSLGYFVGIYPKPYLPVTQCMADDGQSVIIDPSGNLGTCEHFVDSHFWGHIDNPSEKNFDELNIWREYSPVFDICNDCPFYASCVKPKYCNEMGKCDEQYKEWRIKGALRGLIKCYKDLHNSDNNLPMRLAENVL